MNIESTEKGSLGIMHLKRFFHQTMLKKQGMEAGEENVPLNFSLFDALRMGIEPTINFLYSQNPTFENFEDWIRENSGPFLQQEDIDTFNRAVANLEDKAPYKAPNEYLLTEEELKFWDENGYLIVRNAISKEDCRETLDLIFDFLNIREDDPSTWYQPHDFKHGIMVQLFNHPILERNRRSPKIKSVYEQLWQSNDILVSADRVSFNPPETTNYPFQGPDLHWDVSLQLPIPLGLQGLLYLSDTAENQGAFTLVPGFHKRIDAWLGSLDKDDNPREQDIHALGSKPIAADAGDFIVWHHALPHGSSPNTARVPRIVQYINYLALSREIRENWL